MNWNKNGREIQQSRSTLQQFKNILNNSKSENAKICIQ